MYVDGPQMTVDASARAPSGVSVRGHGRWDARRLFHEVAVSVRDASGTYTSAQCSMRHVWTVPMFNTTTNVTKMEWRSAPAFTTARKMDAQGRSTTTMTIGPYEKGYLLTPRCRVGGGKGTAIKYTVWATSHFQMKLLGRLVIGVVLLVVAPHVANSVTCFYTVAMTLSTLALAMIVIHRFARSIPGWIMVKRTIVLAGFATYHFVPAEQWQSVMDMYMQVSMKPVTMVLHLIKRRYASASLETILSEDPWALYGALTGFGLIVLGAGVGRWLVKSFVLDTMTGGVAAPVRSFVTTFIRFIGCGLIQFSSRDVSSATAMVVCAVTYCLYAPVVRVSDRIVDAARRTVHGSSSNDDYHDEFHLHRLSNSESESDSEEVERTRGALYTFGLRRRRRPLPESLDPDHRTPPRRMDTARMDTPNLERRYLIHYVHHNVIRALRYVPGVQWFVQNTSTTESHTRRGSDESAAETEIPPVGSAARAHGRFLTEEEHVATGAIATDQALEHLAKSPEFAIWLAKNAHRVRVTPR